jgi:hypothetical protein
LFEIVAGKDGAMQVLPIAPIAGASPQAQRTTVALGPQSSGPSQR